MNLLLLRHGQSVPADENSERPLSREGIVRIQDSAAAMRQLGLNFDLIACSPLRRSHQSAALVCEAVRYPYSDILETDTLLPDAPATETLEFLRRQTRQRTVLIAGHLPNLTGLAGLLLGGSTPAPLRIDPGGLTLLQSDSLAPASAELVFHLTPTQLALIAHH